MPETSMRGVSQNQRSAWFICHWPAFDGCSDFWVYDSSQHSSSDCSDFGNADSNNPIYFAGNQVWIVRTNAPVKEIELHELI
jgi:hypothetical protein